MVPSVYTLNNGADGIEQSRLDWQHNVFFRMTNNALLPNHIAQHLSKVSSPRIADVATGSGVWLKAMAANLSPVARLDGFDFDTSKFPTPDRLPENVTLQFGDILKPFPSKYHGTYDLVHVRLIVFALKKEDWKVVAKNLTALLKPGGWLLWEEAGYPSWITLPPSKAWYKMVDCAIRYAESSGLDISLAIEGLEDDVTKALARVCTQKVYGIVEKGGVEGLKTTKNAQDMIDAIRRDFENGVKACMELKWVWGRKDPMSDKQKHLSKL